MKCNSQNHRSLVMRFVLFFILTIFVSVDIHSQTQVTIAGIVRDENGQPLPGANIKAIGAKGFGTATDINGQFAINLPTTVKQIEVTFMGYQTMNVSIQGKKRFEISMKPDQRSLEEVVVTGVFTRKANTYTGSVSTIKNEELMRAGNQNILQSLKNVDPSFMQVENLSAGSNPNSLPDFQMRGSSSITSVQGEYSSSANQPLFILDGFEAALTKIMDLDMNQVESVTLLKDATAKAIYGSKAANGVIVIELKRPDKGRMRISYTGNLNIEAPDLSSYNLCNAAEKLEVERMSGMFNSDNGLTYISRQKIYTNKLKEVLAGVNTDWIAQPTRTGIGQKHALYMEGGDENMLYGIDLSMNNIEGVMKGSDRNTFSGGVTLSYRVKNLNFRNKLTIDYNLANESPWGAFSLYTQMNPYSRLYDNNGNLIKSYDYTNAAGTSIAATNPIWNSTINTKDISKYTSITNNTYLEWQAQKNLKLTARFGITKKLTSQDIFKPASHTDFTSYTSENLYRKGSYYKSNGDYTDWSGDLNASYTLQFQEKHLLFFNTQASLANNTYGTSALTAEGYPNDYMDYVTYAVQYLKDGKPSGTEGISRSAGLLGSLNYSYDDRYLFDANYRLNGSSECGSNKRWGSFWSVGAGWNIHKESFMKDVKFISRLKLRASTGFTGSQGFSSYDAMPTVSYYSSSSYNGSIGSYLYGLANPNLKWQEKYDNNFGVDISLFKNRITGRFDYYTSTTKGMLTDVTVPQSTGFTTYRANLGETENKGFEAYLNARIWDQPKNHNYINVYASVAHNKNTLKKISSSLSAWNDEQDKLVTDGQITPVVRYVEGQSMNAIWAVKSMGIDPENGKEIFVKKDGTVTYTYDANDQIVCGDALPKINGNVGLNAEIHNIGLSVAFGYRLGGQLYNSTLVSKVENANLAYNVDRRVFTDRWQKEGDIALYKAITDQTVTRPTSRFVQDYNTFTLSSLNIYYDFRDCKFIKNSFLDRLKVSAYASDLFILSSVKTERGIIYPYSRTFSFSVQATF